MPRLDYEPKAVQRKLYCLSPRLWFAILILCIFIEWAGAFATNGRINGWPDICFVLIFATIGVFAFFNWLRLLHRH